MTFFDFIVPVIALVVAGVGIALVHQSGRRLDRNGQGHHPAE